MDHLFADSFDIEFFVFELKPLKYTTIAGFILILEYRISKTTIENV
jgi:hypothetical protein